MPDRQGKAIRWLCGGVVLLTTLLVSQHLAGGNSPSFHFYPLSPPNALAPTSEPSTEAAPDPRAIELAKRLRQHLAGLQTASFISSPQLTPEQSQALSELETRCPGDVSVVLRPTVGTPYQIEGAVLQQAQYGFAAGSDPHLTTARTFLRTNCDLLRLDDPHSELVLVRRHTDELGRTHLRFRQQYQDLPVWPADVIVHLNPDGHVDVMNGVFVPTPKKLGTVPVLDEATAVEYARTGLTDGAEAEVTAAELIIYAPGDTPPRLAWKLELDISLTSRWLVVIDAINGAELTAYSQIMHQHVVGSGIDLFGRTRRLNVWQDGSFFGMIDTSKLMFAPGLNWRDHRGAIWIYDARNLPPTSRPEEFPFPPSVIVNSSSSTSGWLRDGVSAAYNLSEVYDYYLERHNRNSFDGQGTSIRAIVRFGRNYVNAFWNTGLDLMVFGNALPFAGALDVVGHELTHGVIHHSEALEYLNQPGALNEAFADIFGEMIEARTTGRPPDWLVGGELDRPLRNMANPATLTFDGSRPYPTRMSEFVYTHEDNGGVHINSSIVNRAYYLLAAGLEGAIGLRDAERIFYRALTVYLVRYSQFINARMSCIQAAEDLFGQGSRQAQKTAEAFDAVEIFDAAPPTPEPPTVPSVRGPDSTLFVYRSIFGNFRLGRREDALGDEASGTPLATTLVAAARPSVSRNGEFAVFVNTQNDICAIRTNGSGESCFGFPGLIHSVAMSPDGQLFGFVFLNAPGNPDNKISVFDLESDKPPRTFTLRAPAYDAPGGTDTILHADAMDFTLDGQWLVYDALNAATFSDGSFQQWSLYALHLETGRNLALIPPIRGLDIGFPALSQTSDNFLTFDVFDATRNQSTVFAGNLNTGDLKLIATVAGGLGKPGYTGDDAAIVYSQRDPGSLTGFSLLRQPLATDRLTPQGQASIWLESGDFGVIYRRSGLIGTLENPLSGSFQSGIGLFSGWVCDALRVEIEINGGARLKAAYGTSRGDTVGRCGDSNNGFALPFNWNLLGNGRHTVRALADGVEFDRATFTVTTLGTEFLTGAGASYTLADFPQAGRRVRIDWQEASQNFVITSSSGARPPRAAVPQNTIGPPGTLEIPRNGSFQSGIGLFSGWVCEAQTVEIEIDGTVTLEAAYGTSRGDTAGRCGDSNNGFGLLFNWNLLGDGPHTVRALADGREFGRARFTVTTLGRESLAGVSGTYTLPNFPEQGKNVIVQWQQASQNFVIVGVE